MQETSLIAYQAALGEIAMGFGEAEGFRERRVMATWFLGTSNSAENW